ncbi:MAG TPA: hypothetical protein VD788_07670 [Candidatus Polarisedimenticolaceae bacterium]|nr:hypothetical protein [Candidatus Polarisedimenticolaceae bacterium]
MRRLHLAGGDSVVGRLAASGVDGEFLCWSDVLHEGPVPGGLSPEQLNTVRATFLAQRYASGSLDDVRRALQARLARLAGAADDDEVTLWFAHDLADQLRLLQLLDWFARDRATAPKLTLVSIDAHPEVARFRELAQLTPRQLSALDWSRRRVHDGDFELARRAWAAFTAAEPTGLVELGRDRCRALPFLSRALHRHLQQFPGSSDGLSRTEREILDHVALRGGTVREAFEVTQNEYEEAPFLGPATFLHYVDRLLVGPEPLLDFAVGFRDSRWFHRLRLTAHGRETLAGRRQRHVRGGVDRWLGGVHLDGPTPAWVWDAASQSLIAGVRHPPPDTRPDRRGDPPSLGRDSG